MGQAERGSDPLRTPFTLTRAVLCLRGLPPAEPLPRPPSTWKLVQTGVVTTSPKNHPKAASLTAVRWKRGRALARRRERGGGNGAPWAGGGRVAPLVFQAQDCSLRSAHLPLAAARGRVLAAGRSAGRGASLGGRGAGRGAAQEGRGCGAERGAGPRGAGGAARGAGRGSEEGPRGARRRFSGRRSSGLGSRGLGGRYSWGGSLERGAGPLGAAARDAGRGLEAGPRGGARRRPLLASRAAAEVPAARGQPSSGRCTRSSPAAGERGPGPGRRPRRGAPPPASLCSPRSRGEGGRGASRAGTMNRSFHKSQTLRFYDCSAVEVKSKVSPGWRCAPPANEWAPRGARGGAGARGRRLGGAGSRRPSRPSADTKPADRRGRGARRAGAVRPVARAPDPPRERPFCSRSGRRPALRTAAGPRGPGPGAGPGRSACFPVEKPRSRRGEDRGRPPARPRPSPPGRAGPTAPRAARARPERARTCGRLCAFGFLADRIWRFCSLRGRFLLPRRFCLQGSLWGTPRAEEELQLFGVLEKGAPRAFR